MKSITDIAAETARAHALHGRSFESGSDDKKLRRLVEEVGEVAEAIEDIEAADLAIDAPESERGTNEEVRQRVQRKLQARSAARDHLRAELVQVASLAVRWVDQMDGVE